MSNDLHEPLKSTDSNTDSDESCDNGSISSSQVDTTTPLNTKSSLYKKRKNTKSLQKWVILEGLRDGQRCEDKPDKYQGFLMKRRKWPLKGWHKRFFTLEKGILSYAKSPNDILKGKLHGVIDIGLAVITYKGERLDIDAEQQVYHIKVKHNQAFSEWLSRLRHHRLYRQNEIAYGSKELPRLTDLSSPIEDAIISPLATVNYPEKSRSLALKKEIIRQASFKSSVGQTRVAAWVLDTAGFEKCNKGLRDAQSTLCELHDLLQNIQNLPLSGDATNNVEFPEHLINSCEKPKSRRFPVRSSKRKDKKNDSPSHNRDSINSSPTLGVPEKMHTSTSNPNLLSSTDRVRPISLPESSLLPAHETRIHEIKLRESFICKAEIVHSNLKSLVHMIGTERERLKNTLEADISASNASILTSNTPNHSNQAVLLRQKLAESNQQNAELRARLIRIGAECNLTSFMPIVSPPPSSPTTGRARGELAQSLSAESFSMSEYYDAEENIEAMSDTSSEASDEDISSEVSEDGNETAITSASEEILNCTCPNGRRTKLPVPKPDAGDLSLWNLLYKNIGKDLTKISMPVTLNEPLSSLQRLCEELEYSDLLDKAAEYDDPYERMIYIAAFAVSSYASSYYRAGHKPFNPLLGETYECIREDKGWRFVAEQVSHHPPISACYADSRNFVMWQDMRIKTKFWGKSMEIQPLGTVNVTLPKYNDHYRWNKVTTCVHNLLGGQRWVDQYGEMKITNGNIVCKLTFTKASHWTSKRHEVCGTICTSDGKVVHNLFGKWNEGLFCGHGSSASCIWRPGSMPEDSELYYGFSRFAIELNEVDSDQSRFLPSTDSRFRPDQRMLEEGRIQDSESEKSRVEQLQRERRKREDKESHPLWFRKTVIGDKEVFQYNKKYWETRKDPGFLKMSIIRLW